MYYTIKIHNGILCHKTIQNFIAVSKCWIIQWNFHFQVLGWNCTPKTWFYISIHEFIPWFNGMNLYPNWKTPGSWQVPLVSMAEISHSASCPPTKGMEYLSFSDRNTYLFCCIVAFSALLLFNPLTDFPCSFACAWHCLLLLGFRPKFRV
jgi:hypothetical protein